MLQIIGWMGCVYLFVKAFELFSVAKNRQDDQGIYDMLALTGGGVSMLGGILFFFLIETQLSEMPAYPSSF